MLILLPPSEGKTPAPSHKEPIDFSVLHFPELNPVRRQVLDVLASVSSQDDALSQLKVGKSLVDEVERNTRLLDEPATDASQIYSGVLFEALDYDSLSLERQELADRHVLVVSALWGLLRLDDVVPAYRLSMGTKLGELGGLATFWKKHLSDLIADSWHGKLILDCRSSAYQKALPTDPSHTYEVKALSVGKDGSRKVISHMAKHYRGLVARAVLTPGLADSNNIDEIVNHLSQQMEIEVVHPAGKKPGTLTVLVTAD